MSNPQSRDLDADRDPEVLALLEAVRLIMREGDVLSSRYPDRGERFHAAYDAWMTLRADRGHPWARSLGYGS
jgi:hypothetical protein